MINFLHPYSKHILSELKQGYTMTEYEEAYPYQHSRVYSRECLTNCVRWFLWQSRSLWVWEEHLASSNNTANSLAAGRIQKPNTTTMWLVTEELKAFLSKVLTDAYYSVLIISNSTNLNISVCNVDRMQKLYGLSYTLHNIRCLCKEKNFST